MANRRPRVDAADVLFGHGLAMPCGVGLCGLRGYDMVESQVTVMISLSILVSLRLMA